MQMFPQQFRISQVLCVLRGPAGRFAGGGTALRAGPGRAGWGCSPPLRAPAGRDFPAPPGPHSPRLPAPAVGEVATTHLGRRPAEPGRPAGRVGGSGPRRPPRSPPVRPHRRLVPRREGDPGLGRGRRAPRRWQLPRDGGGGRCGDRAGTGGGRRGDRRGTGGRQAGDSAGTAPAEPRAERGPLPPTAPAPPGDSAGGQRQAQRGPSRISRDSPGPEGRDVIRAAGAAPSALRGRQRSLRGALVAPSRAPARAPRSPRAAGLWSALRPHPARPGCGPRSKAGLW